MNSSTHHKIDQFFKPFDDCQGTIYLRTKHGDVYNLKSKIGQFSAIHVLLHEPEDSMVLICSLQEEKVLLKTHIFHRHRSSQFSS